MKNNTNKQEALITYDDISMFLDTLTLPDKQIIVDCFHQPSLKDLTTLLHDKSATFVDPFILSGISHALYNDDIELFAKEMKACMEKKKKKRTKAVQLTAQDIEKMKEVAIYANLKKYWLCSPKETKIAIWKSFPKLKKYSSTYNKIVLGGTKELPEETIKLLIKNVFKTKDAFLQKMSEMSEIVEPEKKAIKKVETNAVVPQVISEKSFLSSLGELSNGFSQLLATSDADELDKLLKVVNLWRQCVEVKMQLNDLQKL